MMTQFKTQIDLQFSPLAITEGDLGVLTVAEEESKQKDLLYVKFLLVSSGSNNNLDYFLPLEMMKAWKSPRDKQINWKHNSERIIGHMKNSVLTYNGARLTEEEIDAFLKMEEPPKGQYDIYCSGVIYKVHCPLFASTIINSVTGKAKRGDANYMSVSMEVLFTNWYYLVGESVFGQENSDKFDMMRANRINHQGHPVFRVLKNMTFSGCGMTPKPANKRSELVAVASELADDVDMKEEIALHKNERPSALPDDELVFDHSLLHRLYKIYLEKGKVKGWSREEMLNYHSLVAKEMKKRDFEHNAHDKMDEDSEKFAHAEMAIAIDLNDEKKLFLQQFPEIIDLKGDYISVIGSFVDADHHSDIDLYADNSFKLDTFSDLLPTGQKYHIVEAAGEPSGNKVPLYKLALVRATSFDIIGRASTYDLFDTDIEFYSPQRLVSDPAELKSIISSYDKILLSKYVEGTAVMVHKSRNGEVPARIFALDEYGNEVVIAEVFDALLKSDTGDFIVLATITDNALVLTDYIYRRSGDLVDVAASTRMQFLQKLYNSIDKSGLQDFDIKINDYIVTPPSLLFENMDVLIVNKNAESIIVMDATSSYDKLAAENWCVFNEGDSIIDIRVVDKANAAEVPSVQLMKPFKPIKTGAGYGKFEFFDIDSAIKFWANGIFEVGGKIIVQEKFDGARVVGHKKGEEVKLFTEDKKRDISAMLPDVAAAVKSLKGDLILDGEMLVYNNDGTVLPREETMKFIAGKQPVAELVKWNLFDQVYADEGSMANLPYSERFSKLEETVGKKDLLPVAKSITVSNVEELKKAYDELSNVSGSEGVVLKNSDFIYTLNGRTNDMAKVKNFKEVVVQITAKIKKTGSSAFIFVCAYKGQDGKLVKIGKTFAASIDANVGDLLEVRVQKIFDNGEGKAFTWFHPIPVAHKGTEANIFTEEDMKRIAKVGVGKASEIGLLFVEDQVEPIVVSLDFMDKYYSEANESVAADDLYMVAPGWSGKYVMQEHHRGKSVHTDFRMERPGGNLMGWTLDTPGKNGLRSKVFKGQTKDRILAEQKLEQPHLWLTFEGQSKAGNQTADGLPEPGATKNNPGVFVIKDKGTFIAGISKPYFHEYFLKSDLAGVTDGRWMARELQLTAKPMDQDETPKNAKMVKAWLLWRPQDQTPYGDQKGEDIPKDQVQAWQKAKSKVYKLLGTKQEAKAQFTMSFAADYSVDGEKWYVEGYASTNDLDRGSRVITSSALQQAATDLIGETLYKNHIHEDEVGTIVDSKVIDEGDSTKLWIKALVSQTKPEIWQMIREGVLGYFSIGGKATDFYFDLDASGSKIQIITGIELLECSLTGIPANPNAKVISWYASSAKEEDYEMAEKNGEEVLVPETEAAAAVVEPVAAEVPAPEGDSTAASEQSQEAEVGAAQATEPVVEPQEAVADDWKVKYEEAIAQLAKANQEIEAHNATEQSTARMQECTDLDIVFSEERRASLSEKFKAMDAIAFDEWLAEVLEAKYSYAAIPPEVTKLMDSIKKANPGWAQGKIMKEAWKAYKKEAKAEETTAAVQGGMLKVVEAYIKIAAKIAADKPDAKVVEVLKAAFDELKKGEYGYPAPATYPEPVQDTAKKGAKADEPVRDPAAALDGEGAVAEGEPAAVAADDPSAVLDNLTPSGEQSLNLEADPKPQDNAANRYALLWAKK